MKKPPLRTKRTTSPARKKSIRKKPGELPILDLRAVRELVGKTQLDVANVTDMTQPEVSQLERRQDVRLSTLQRFIEALGGELEVFAAFGDKRVRLRAAG
jgi:hypothetical protein